MAFVLARFTLDDPFVLLTIDVKGQTNFQKALSAHNPSPPAAVPVQNEEKGKFPKLFFAEIGIANGVVKIEDSSQQEVYNYTLAPISFILHDFSTYKTEHGEYELDVALGDEQVLAWHGNIGVAPFHSTGTLSLVNINTDMIWNYIKDFSPYVLQQGRVDIAGQYQLELGDETPVFQVTDIMLTMREIDLAHSGIETPFMRLNRLDVGPVAFDLAENSLKIEKILADQFTLAISRNKEGDFDLLRPLAQMNTKKYASPSTTPPAPDNDGLHWSINTISMQNSALSWHDTLPSSPADIEINSIDITIAGLSEELSQPFDYSLAWHLPDSGMSKIHGSATAKPISLTGELRMQELALPLIQPYITDHLRLEIEQGLFSLNGNAALQIKGSRPEGQFRGELTIADLNSSDQLSGKRQAAFRLAQLAC